MRHGAGSGQSVVIGRLHDDRLAVLRATTDGEEPRLRVVAWAEMAYRPGEALGEPLERRVGFRSGDALYLTAPTPSLVGETVLERLTDGRDDRGARHDLRQRVRERVRERAAQAFGRTLESVYVLSDVVEDHGPVRAATALASTDASFLAVPPDLPGARSVLLPLLLAEDRSWGGSPLGVVVMEEEELTFVLAVRGVPLLVRTVALGTRRLAESVREALACAPSEAERVLTRAAEGNLPTEAFRPVLRVLRPYVPLYAAWWTLAREALQGLPLPECLLVVGRWSSFLLRLYARQPFIGRVLSPGGSVRRWPLLGGIEGVGAVPSAHAEMLLPLLEVVARLEGLLPAAHARAAVAARAGVRNAVHEPFPR